MTAGEQVVLEEIYTLWLTANGKRERRTRAAIASLIGERRAEVLRREWAATRQRQAMEGK